jgi:hypothetical protein
LSIEYSVFSSFVYLGLRVKCRRIASSRTDRLCCCELGKREERGISLGQYKQWEYPPYCWYSPPEPHIISDTRPNGPICYAFLPSRATRYNSDFPSFPRYGTIYYGSLVRYLAAQVKTVDLGECGTGRSGRDTAVSDPIH